MGGSVLGRSEKIAIWMGIIGNAILFGAKIVIGLTFDSISIISDSLNSFTVTDRIIEAVRGVPGVLETHDVIAHYVGTLIEIEVHINVDRRLNIEEAHAIGKGAQRAVEGMEGIARAFIHIDPLEAGAEPIPTGEP
jgi:divalent metal cation (Fe/Co/Zn/Cd) transporter